MSMARKLFALLLAAAMLLTAGAFAEIPEYLHVDQTPLVTEPITLRMICEVNDETTDPLDSWVYAYVTQVLGINLEVEYFYNATRNERISLMMADGDLPDLIMSCSLTASELTRYGLGEGLLLDMAPYINEENAPNLTKYLAEKSYVAEAITMPGGQIYSLPYVMEEPMGTQSIREYYNFDWLEALELDVPETLDEFVDMLRAFDAYGDELGIDVIPLGGNYSRCNPTYLIFNALGYNFTGDYHLRTGYETMIGMRNGEIVLPCYDREAYPKYLETMHTIYSEGLMEQDFFTLDKDTAIAHLVAGRYGVFSDPPAVHAGTEFGRQWFGGTPLTSEYNDTPFWPNYTGVTIGGLCISADTEYPEVCVAFADYIYGDGRGNYFANANGPSVNETDILLGKTAGWYFDHDVKDTLKADWKDHETEYESCLFYSYDTIPLWRPHRLGRDIGYVEAAPDENGEMVPLCEYPEGDDVMELAKTRLTTTNVNDQYKLAQVLGWGRYLTDEFVPTVFYFDEDTNLRVEELATLINEYATQETAKFIIGTRDLSEIDDYFAELEKLGADEYVGYYADYYATMKG